MSGFESRDVGARRGVNPPPVDHTRRGSWTESIVLDLKLALRMLRNNPLFTSISVLTLAIGFGANASIFSVVNHLLLQPLPYPGADRLVTVWSDFPNNGQVRWPASGPQFVALEEPMASMEDLAGIWATNGAITGDDDPLQVRVAQVTWNFFDVVKAAPQLGRGFESDEQAPGGRHAIILSDGLWQSRYGGDPNIIGRSITFDGITTEVVGVAPPGFSLPFTSDSKIPAQFDAWIPFTFDFPEMHPELYFIRMVGRLKSGVSIEQARAELSTVSSHLRDLQDAWSTPGLELSVYPLKGDSVSEYRPALLALLGAVAVVLLLACCNIANLLLARASDRRREFAMRAALGASTGRLLRQLLIESLVLFTLSGAAGMVLASFGTDLLWAIRPAGLASFESVPLSLDVYLYSMAICFACGLICGVLPVIEANRANLAGTLKGGDRTVGQLAGARYRKALLVSEVAGGLVLLVVSALFINSLVQLHDADPGFRSDGVLTFRIVMPESAYPDDASRARLVADLHASLEGIPGVTVAGAASHIPLDDEPNWATNYVTREDPDPAHPPTADQRAVVPGYLEAIGATLVEGRFFSEDDYDDAADVVIVDESLVRRRWGDVSGLGHEIRFTYDVNGEYVDKWARVVGVIKHVKHYELTADGTREQFYFPYAQYPFLPRMTFVARTAGGDPRGLVDAVRRSVFALDPNLPVSKVLTLDDYIDRSLTSARFTTLVLGIFSGVALLLATIGLYGVLAYQVRRRTREFGILMALGATPRRLWKQVVRYGLGLTLLGVAIGVPLALAITRLLTGMLFDVSPADPLTYLAIVGLFLVVAFLACLLPARRAMRVDPLVALRSE